MSSFKQRSLIVLRWIAVAPAAIGAAAVARLVLVATSRWMTHDYVPPDSYLEPIWRVFIGTVGYTMVLVSVAAYVAPFGKKAVSIVVATVATTVAVPIFVMSLLTKDYESTFFSLCYSSGACITSYWIVQGEIELPDERTWNCNDNKEMRDTD